MTSSTQTAAIAAKERAFSSKYSPKTRAAKEAAQAELIAKRRAFEAEHLEALRRGDPAVVAQFRAIK